ncbi:unnamed protein product [Owenia fusiformis]|uniref:guanylate cyclase n=1 Tax=Owenia fusiformis TaxID=6347 RepID=A0A8S4PHC8_OWEFU|nr:unnamed protein product [Owenia fusiformis]
MYGQNELIHGLVIEEFDNGNDTDKLRVENADKDILDKNIVLGVLLPNDTQYDYTAWETNYAAVTWAVEDAKMMAEKLNLTKISNYTIKIKYLDTQCDPEKALGPAVHLRHAMKIDVVIGPACSQVADGITSLAAYWDFPVFSHASRRPDLDKNPTLSRVSPTYTRVGEVYKTLIEEYEWTSIHLLYTEYDDDDEDDDGENKIVILLLEEKQVIDVLRRSQEMELSQKEFLFLVTYELDPGDLIRTPWLRNNGTDVEKNLFDNVFEVSARGMIETHKWFDGKTSTDFRKLLPAKMKEKYDYGTNRIGSIHSLYLYDTVLAYLTAVNNVVGNNKNPFSGKVLLREIEKKEFKFMGRTGEVRFDPISRDRLTEFVIWHKDKVRPRYEQYASVYLDEQKGKMVFDEKMTPNFITPDGLPPPTIPVCGYEHERCNDLKESEKAAIIAMTLVGFLVIAVVGIVFLRRRQKIAAELLQSLWKIPHNLITPIHGHGSKNSYGTIDNSSKHSMKSTNMAGIVGQSTQGEDFRIGVYKGYTVYLKPMNLTTLLSLTKKDYQEMKHMKDMNHDNINTFFGLTVGPKSAAVVSFYCSKGSLEDIINNVDIKLDFMFKHSMLCDLVEGMLYLHNSPLMSHGSLKSSNCLIDGRWQLKISDYGLCKVRHDVRLNAGEDSHYYGCVLSSFKIV